MIAPTSFLSNVQAPPQLKVQDYPTVRFWTESQWKHWNESAEGQLSKQTDRTHNTRFLEDLNSIWLDATRVAKILDCMRDIWHGFRLRNAIDATTTLKTMSHDLKTFFCNEMVKSHPETNLGEGAWKIDRLAKDHYSSYKQTWFTNKSKEKLALKRKVKLEMIDAEGSTASREHPAKHSKRECTSPDVEPSTVVVDLVVSSNSNSMDLNDLYEVTSSNLVSIQFLTSLPQAPMASHHCLQVWTVISLTQNSHPHYWPSP
ncbi:hypothetical protein JVU11DRAFT_10531 [Chiua virens]|nr:hypothetical protein JVU11DRAFT_10531 [Chiua virens]